MDNQELELEIQRYLKELPEEARALRERCTVLSESLRAGEKKGAAQSLEQSAQANAEALSLRLQMPVLMNLHQATRSTRLVVNALQGDLPMDQDVDKRITALCERWFALLRFIMAEVDGSEQVEPVLDQVKQLREVAMRRRAAVDLLRKAEALRSVSSGELQRKIALQIAEWRSHYCDAGSEDVGAQWLAQARASFQLLKDASPQTPSTPPSTAQAPVEVRETQAANQRAPEAPVPESPVSVPPPGEPQAFRHRVVEPLPPFVRFAPDHADATAANQEPVRQEPSMLLPQIAHALAECSDLELALGVHSEATDEFKQQMQDLYDGSGAQQGRVQKLKHDVDSYCNQLVERAKAVKGERMERLRSRWRRFQSIYSEPNRGLEESYRKAEAQMNESASQLSRFFETVQNAMDRIDATADSDRGPLQQALRNAVVSALEAIQELQSRPLTCAADAELTSLARKLPNAERPTLEPSACFQYLDECDEVQAAVAQQRNEIVRKQEEFEQRIKHARALAASMDDLKLIPHQAPLTGLLVTVETSAFRWLDEKEAELTAIERTLARQRDHARRLIHTEVAAMRQRKKSWAQQLRDFHAPLQELASTDHLPEDFEALINAFRTEQQDESKIRSFVGVAAAELNIRRNNVIASLGGYLASPSFEGSPDREEARSSLHNLELLGDLAKDCTLAQFDEQYNCVALAEEFLDRIEAPRRRVPQQIELIEQRYRWLNSHDVGSLRPRLASRVLALLLGLKGAIKRDDYLSADDQIHELNYLMDALEKDIRSRVGAEARDLASRLEGRLKRTTDERTRLELSQALARLKEAGHHETPSRRVRNNARTLLEVGSLRGSEARRP